MTKDSTKRKLIEIMFWVGYVTGILIYLGIVGGIIVIVWHFAAKYW